MKETVLPSPGAQYTNPTDSPVFRETGGLYAHNMGSGEALITELS